jgi:hypothetical protein
LIFLYPNLRAALLSALRITEGVNCMIKPFFSMIFAIFAAVTAAPVQGEEVDALEAVAVEEEVLLLEEEAPAAVEEIVFDAEVADCEGEASSEE